MPLKTYVAQRLEGNKICHLLAISCQRTGEPKFEKSFTLQMEPLLFILVDLFGYCPPRKTVAFFVEMEKTAKKNQE